MHKYIIEVNKREKAALVIGKETLITFTYVCLGILADRGVYTVLEDLCKIDYDGVTLIIGLK
jgi:hypothetical protein